MSGVTSVPNLESAGKILATLDDLRAIMYFAMFIFIAMIIERVISHRTMSAERKTMAEERNRAWDTAQKFGTNAELVAKALNTLTTEITVLRALSSRVESNIIARQDDAS